MFARHRCARDKRATSVSEYRVRSWHDLAARARALLKPWCESAFAGYDKNLGASMWCNVRSLMCGFLWISSLGLYMTTLESRLEFIMHQISSISDIWVMPTTGLMCLCMSLPFTAVRTGPVATLAAILPTLAIVYSVVDMFPKGVMMARVQHITAQDLLRRHGELEE